VKQDNEPEVVDLRRYRQAAADRAKAKVAAAPATNTPAGRQPLLRSRRNAGLILALAAAAFVALTFGPQLLAG
jgi:hypothetical protein